MVILSPWIVKILFGADYAPSISALHVLIPGVFVYSLLNVVASVQVALGRTDISFYVTLITGIFNVVANILFIKRIGMVGAAWATVLTYTINLIIRIIWTSRLHSSDV